MKPLIFRVHAIQKMFERNISDEDVRQVVESGEVIRNYPDDQPYPSRLLLAWRGDRPLHVVAADNEADNETIIITAYEPNPTIWKPNFKVKKEQDT